MKMSPSLFNKAICAIVAIWFCVGCDPSGRREYRKGESLVHAGDFKESLAFFDRVIARVPGSEWALKSLREGARVAFFDAKEFKKSAEYYHGLVLYSPSSDERMTAQKQIADIYFDHLAEYEKAVLEINKVIAMSPQGPERTKYKIKLARAYYYQNNFAQALAEVDEFLKTNINDESEFEMIVLRGNIFLAKKDLQQASNVFKDLVVKYPERAVKENVALTLAVAYEEMKDYPKAISVLETIKQHHPMPEYIDIRIKRLSERKQNQPGARGMRK